MKILSVDYSNKHTDAVHATASAVSADCEQCSVTIDGATKNLLRAMHPTQRQQCSVPRQLGRGEHLFRAGDKLDAVYVVQSGVFKRYFTSEAGAETVADFVRTGQLLGIEALLHGTASMAAVALDERAAVCELPLPALESVPDTCWSAWLMSTICEERDRERSLRSIQEGQSKAETRLAFFLLEHATGHGRRALCSHSVQLAIPQQDIARYLNLEMETVARAFSHLQKAGIIRIERSAFTVVEPEILLMLASSDPFDNQGQESITALQRGHPISHP